MRKVAGATLVLVAVALWPCSPRAEASGIITHSWMAAEAIPRVADPQLRGILSRQRALVEAGAHFPDSGYAPGLTYGEAAHWPRYHDEVARRIAATCDLEAPSSTCERSIAHLFGAVAHGIGDQVWDWLFEPNAPDRGESYVPPALQNAFSPNGLEMQMDLVAIRDFDRRTSPAIPTWPVPSRLSAAFTATGETGGSADALQDGYIAISVARNAERQLTADHHDDIVRNMPWTSSHVVTAPGGIRFASRAIAAAWDHLWQRMQGATPAAEVSVTYPADGEERVPATGWERDAYLPGSAPDRGGARNRITAVVDAPLPYALQPGDDVDELLPPGAMTLTDVTDGEVPVPVKDGYPRQVPYGAEAGEHTIDLQPAADLEPCHTYRVDVTSALLDQDEQPVTPHAWTFTTAGCPGVRDQPDLAAKRGATGALVGDDVHNGTAAGQNRFLRTPAGRTATFYVRAQNDGNRPDRVRLSASGPARPGFGVRYFDGPTDVTARVVAGTYRTPLLNPGASKALRVVVAVRSQAPVGAEVTRTVSGSSVNDGAIVDRVRVTVRRAAPARARPEAFVSPARLSTAELADAARYVQICQLV